MEIKINDKPYSIENSYLGIIIDTEGQEHQFWLVQGKDVHQNEISHNVNWFFKKVPREIREMELKIIEEFKRTHGEINELSLP